MVRKYLLGGLLAAVLVVPLVVADRPVGAEDRPDSDGWRLVSTDFTSQDYVFINTTPLTMVVQSDFIGWLHHGERPPKLGQHSDLTVVGWADGTHQIIWETPKEGLTEAELIAQRAREGFTHTGWIGRLSPEELAAARELLGDLEDERRPDTLTEQPVASSHYRYSCRITAHTPVVNHIEAVGRVEQTCTGLDVVTHVVQAYLTRDGVIMALGSGSRQPGTIRISLSSRCSLIPPSVTYAWRTDGSGLVHFYDGETTSTPPDISERRRAYCY